MLNLTTELRARTEQLRRATHDAVMPLAGWTATRRFYLKPQVRFDLDAHFYLAGIYNCTSPEVVVYKASQMGASEWAISYVLWSLDLRRTTVLYVFPTSGDVSDFSSARFGPALDASPYLAQLVVAGGGRGADRVRLKRVRDNFLYFRGAHVDANGDAPQLKSIDADIVVFDEVDSMSDAAIAIGEKRIGHSRIAETRYISTPTFPNVGVHLRYQDSDQREWFVKCPHCGRRQIMTLAHLVQEFDELGRPVAWHGQEHEQAWLACEKCGGQLDRLARGEWVIQSPGRARAGFHLTKFFSPFYPLTKIINDLRDTSETKRQQVFNQDLGLPFMPKGGGLTAADLDNARRDYAHGPVQLDATGSQVAPSLAGVDVGRVLHVVIREADVGVGQARRQLYAGYCITFEDLLPLFRRFNVVAAVIDALPETKKARDFIARWPGAYIAYYANSQTGIKETDDVKINHEEHVVNADRTRTLDKLVALLMAHAWTLPRAIRDARDYYQHMTASVRVLVDGPQDNKVARWINELPDHYFHAENYCLLASYLPRFVPLPDHTDLLLEEGFYNR